MSTTDPQRVRPRGVILGVTDPWGYDNAAAILVDGQLVGAVEEERLNRIKHAPSSPRPRPSPGAWRKPAASSRTSTCSRSASTAREPSCPTASRRRRGGP